MCSINILFIWYILEWITTYVFAVQTAWQADIRIHTKKALSQQDKHKNVWLLAIWPTSQLVDY